MKEERKEDRGGKEGGRGGKEKESKFHVSSYGLSH